MRKLSAAALFLVFALPAVADEVVPIRPCRVLDTRNTAHGYVPPGTQLDFAVRTAPSHPGPAQGGEAGCGVPYNATSVILNVIAVGPSNMGWANLWAFGTPIPLASVLNVTLSQTENVGTFGLLAANGPAMDLSLRNAGFSTYWVIDILGYVVPSTATLAGQATGILFGNVLTVATSGGLTIKAFVPDTLPAFKASWTSSLPAAVGNCVHVDGLWFHGTTTLEFNTLEARSLPIVIPGYCGPG